MTKSMKLMVLIGLGFLVAAPLALACGNMHRSWNGNGAMVGGWWENAPSEYRLTDAQAKKINDIRNDLRDKSAPIIVKIRQLRQDAYRNGKARINVAVLEKRLKLRQKLQKIHLKYQNRIDKVLTEKQRAYFDTFRCSWEEGNYDSGNASIGMGMGMMSKNSGMDGCVWMNGMDSGYDTGCY